MGIRTFTTPTSKPRLAFFIFQVLALKLVKTTTTTNIGFSTWNLRTNSFETNTETTTQEELQVEEVFVYNFETRPSAISYNYSSGAANYLRPGGFSSDEGGTMPINFSIQGMSGVKPRRRGLYMVDGWTRLKDFREKVFKLSHTINSKDSLELLYGITEETDISNNENLSKVIGDDIVYAINWYDFWNDEAYCVDIRNFKPNSNSQNAYNTPYTIDCQVLGKPIPLKSNSGDGLLFALQKLEWATQRATNIAGRLDIALNDNEIVQLASLIGEGALGSLDIANELMGSIVQNVPSIVSTLKGESITSTLTNTEKATNKFFNFLEGLY